MNRAETSQPPGWKRPELLAIVITSVLALLVTVLSGWVVGRVQDLLSSSREIPRWELLLFGLAGLLQHFWGTLTIFMVIVVYLIIYVYQHEHSRTNG